MFTIYALTNSDSLAWAVQLHHHGKQKTTSLVPTTTFLRDSRTDTVFALDLMGTQRILEFVGSKKISFIISSDITFTNCIEIA